MPTFFIFPSKHRVRKHNGCTQVEMVIMYNKHQQAQHEKRLAQQREASCAWERAQLPE